MNIKIKIILFSFFIRYFYSFIQLSFQTDISNYENLNEREKFLRKEKNDIYINLTIGNPNQKIKIYLFFSSFYFFITNETLNNFYNEKKSKTYKSLEKRSFGYLKEPFSKGQIATDNLILETQNKKIEINNFKFILATEYINNKKKISGGIGFKLKENDKENNDFIHILKNNNITDCFFWSIQYKNNNEGNLIIGAFPHEYDKNYNSFYLKNTKIDLSLNDGFWYLNFNNITFKNFSLDKNNRFQLKIESGFIYGNYQLFYYVFNYFFKEFIEKKICFQNISSYDEDNSFDFFYCNNKDVIKIFPNISFFQKDLNMSFILNYNDLFEKIENNFYFLIVFSRQNLNMWILGKPFFKKYHLIFEPDKKIILSYNGFSKKRNFNNLVYIIIFFILFLIVFLLVLIIKKYMLIKNKVKAIELEDSKNYMSINYF